MLYDNPLNINHPHTNPSYPEFDPVSFYNMFKTKEENNSMNFHEINDFKGLIELLNKPC